MTFQPSDRAYGECEMWLNRTEGAIGDTGIPVDISACAALAQAWATVAVAEAINDLTKVIYDRPV